MTSPETREVMVYVSKAANVPEEEIDDWIVCRSTVAVRVSDSIPLEPSFRLRMWNPAKARVATQHQGNDNFDKLFPFGTLSAGFIFSAEEGTLWL